MKRNKIIGFATLSLILAGLTGCVSGGNSSKNDNSETVEEGHTCAADTIWTTNATKHWHKCTDSTCEETFNEGNHTLNDGEVVKEATCEIPGELKKTCTVCGYTDSLPIAVLGHKYGSTVWSKIATATEDGVGTQTCSRCGDEKTVTSPKTGGDVAHTHTWGSENVVEAIPGQTIGYKYQSCSCQAIKVTINAGDDMNGNLARGGKLGKGSSNTYDGTKISKYVIGSNMAFEGTLYAYGGVDNNQNYSKSFKSGKNGDTPVTLDGDNRNTMFKFNNQTIVACDDAYNTLTAFDSVLESATDVNTNGKINAGLIKIADITMKSGVNVLEMAATNSYGIVYLDLVFIGTPVTAA